MLAPLDQRIHEREATDHRERHAGSVEASIRRHWRAVRQEAPAGGEGEQSDRDIDEEDRPPTGSEHVEVDQAAADERAGDRGEAHDRPDYAERFLLALVAEQLADQAKALWDHERRDRALERPGGDQGVRGGSERAQRRGEHEAADAGEEDSATPEHVAQPAAQQQCHGHGQRVGGRDPLERRVGAAQVTTDRGGGGLRDRRVQQVHDQGGHDHGKAQPEAARLESPARRRLLRG